MVFSVAAVAQSGGTSVNGEVKGARGQLLVSVWVAVSQDGVEKGRSLTGDDGIYYITNLSGGDYDIIVLAGDRELHRERVYLSGDSRHDILIKPRR
jgi:hypothetical protein